MAAYYTLTRKGEETPTNLVQIDEEMCAHFGVTPDVEKWYRNWENTIGLGIALGKNWDQLREIFQEDTDIINWMEEHFISNSWYQR